MHCHAFCCLISCHLLLHLSTPCCCTPSVPSFSQPCVCAHTLRYCHAYLCMRDLSCTVSFADADKVSTLQVTWSIPSLLLVKRSQMYLSTWHPRMADSKKGSRGLQVGAVAGAGPALARWGVQGWGLATLLMHQAPHMLQLQPPKAVQVQITPCSQRAEKPYC